MQDRDDTRRPQPFNDRRFGTLGVDGDYLVPGGGLCEQAIEHLQLLGFGIPTVGAEKSRPTVRAFCTGIPTLQRYPGSRWDPLEMSAKRRDRWLGDDLTAIALLASLIEEAERQLAERVDPPTVTTTAGTTSRRRRHHVGRGPDAVRRTVASSASMAALHISNGAAQLQSVALSRSSRRRAAFCSACKSCSRSLATFASAAFIRRVSVPREGGFGGSLGLLGGFGLASGPMGLHPQRAANRRSRGSRLSPAVQCLGRRATTEAVSSPSRPDLTRPTGHVSSLRRQSVP